MKNHLILSALISGLLFSITSSARANEQPTYCFYGGGKEPTYITGVFYHNARDLQVVDRNKSTFQNLVKNTFTLHPNFEAFNYRVRCESRDSVERAKEVVSIIAKQLHDGGVKVFLTDWQPGILTLKTEQYSE